MPRPECETCRDYIEDLERERDYYRALAPDFDLDATRDRVIVAAVIRCKGSVRKAAKLLGRHHNAVYRWLYKRDLLSQIPEHVRPQLYSQGKVRGSPPSPARASSSRFSNR